MELIKPPSLKPGATVGIFTPSSPANVKYREKYQHGLTVLKRMGFEVVEGSLTASQKSQGYRSGSPQERAMEFMELIRNPQVTCMISTIGGANSSSMIPYLDFDEIRKNPKVICGYSDVTSLHLSILAYAADLSPRKNCQACKTKDFKVFTSTQKGGASDAHRVG